MAGIDPEDIEHRFSRLASVVDSAGEAVIGKLKSVAHEINKAVGSDSPALRSIVQRLEQAAHVASSAPALAEPAAAADPTPAAPEAAASSKEATTSTPDSSTPNSTDSAASSSTESKE